jgi:leucyl/phenylalanyl-tRNA---protein transferase
MFALRTDASKIALAALVAFCRARGIETIDCQQRTPHLASLGGREIARSDFQRRLRTALAGSDVDDWSYDLSLWEQLGLGALAESAGPDASEDIRP